MATGCRRPKEKTLTFTVEDALLSPVGFAILSGAGLFNDPTEKTHFHQTAKVEIVGEPSTIYHYYKWAGTKYVEIEKPSAAILEFLGEDGIATLNSEPVDNVTTQEGVADYAVYAEAGGNGFSVDLTTALNGNHICAQAPVYISVLKDDSIIGTAKFSGTPTTSQDGSIYTDTTFAIEGVDTEIAEDSVAIVDYYILVNPEAKAAELQIDAKNFAGYFYVEANTLVKRRSDGRDLPAVLTIPKVKIQSNFSIAFASSGDPSTFTFTMDAMPGYTYFNRTTPVLCTFQIFEDNEAVTVREPVMREINYHDTEVGNNANGS